MRKKAWDSRGSVLDKLVVDMYGIQKKKGQIGLEIEAEGDLRLNAAPATMWSVKDEHSLRNGGFELASSVLNLDAVPAALDEYREITKGSKFVPSWRTSVHVHCNVQTRTLRQILSIVLAYWMFEDVFCRLNGAGREGNLHCLRLSDADGIWTRLRYWLSQNTFCGFSGKDAAQYRYAALNLSSLAKFGSVEYRFMRLPDDFKDILLWSEILWSLTSKAGDMKPRDVLKFYTGRAVDAYKAFLPQSVWKLIIRDNLTPEYVEDRFKQHFHYAESLCDAIDDHDFKWTSSPVSVFPSEIDLDIASEDDLPWMYSADLTQKLMTSTLLIPIGGVGSWSAYNDEERAGMWWNWLSSHPERVPDFTVPAEPMTAAQNMQGFIDWTPTAGAVSLDPGTFNSALSAIQLAGNEDDEVEFEDDEDLPMPEWDTDDPGPNDPETDTEEI